METPVFINISLDHVAVYCPNKQFIIPYNNLERTLPKALKKIFLTYTPKACIVLNGPWWFTALRISCLTIQMLCDHYAITCYSLPKTLFYRVFFEEWLLPRFYRVYIWQKNNFWLYDFKESKHITVHLSKLTYYLDKIAWMQASYAFDAISDHTFLNAWEKSLDPLFKLLWKSWPDHTTLQYIHTSTHIDPQLFLKDRYKVDTLTPEYMIDPTLS